MNPALPTIAVLDDEPQMRKALQRLLSTHGFVVEDYASGRDFLAALASHPVDCLILDLHMPETNGFEVLEALVSNAMSVVVITGQDEPGTEERIRALGALAFLRKPVDESALLSAIGAAVDSKLKGVSFPLPIRRIPSEP